MGIASYIRLEHGDSSIDLQSAEPNYESTIICTGNEISFPAPRVKEQDRLGRSGKRDQTTLHDAASFQASLKVYGSERHNIVQQIRSMLHPRNRPFVYVWREGWETERRAELRGESVASPIGRTSAAFLEVSIQASIPEGVLEAPVSKTVTMTTSVDSVGMQFTTTGLASTAANGFVMTGVASLNITTIELEGDTVTPPRIWVYGTTSDPSFEVQYEDGTTKVLRLTGLDIPAGDYIEINFAERTILRNSNPLDSYYHKLDFVNSSWWDLEPGLNTVIFTSASAGSDSVAYMEYRDRWIGG